ncbi:hypothetical protein [Herpetosiphon giganteus]|uniref:hypothetical protein n=1 Tax=Herpetosiphon giganteus TaxID=2029754 RepID=UPI00195B3E52|nr:hypothetical protein [Herpetosiphon giganteus]MBM7844895.1 hypothetical protein [Herpetosiphon giganteus]
MQLSIPESDAEAFWAYLGLGVLTAIQRQALDPELGIWTLALPKILERLPQQSELATIISEVFVQADELQLLSTLNPTAYQSVLQQMINQLNHVLSTSKDASWTTWQIDKA